MRRSNYHWAYDKSTDDSLLGCWHNQPNKIRPPRLGGHDPARPRTIPPRYGSPAWPGASELSVRPRQFTDHPSVTCAQHVRWPHGCVTIAIAVPRWLNSMRWPPSCSALRPNNTFASLVPPIPSHFDWTASSIRQPSRYSTTEPSQKCGGASNLYGFYAHNLYP